MIASNDSDLCDRLEMGRAPWRHAQDNDPVIGRADSGTLDAERSIFIYENHSTKNKDK